MSANYAFENLLRSPWELLVAFVAFNFGLLCILHHSWMLLTFNAGIIVSMPFFAIALVRFSQGIRICFYRKNLLTLKPFFMAITELPQSKSLTYLGRGFRWLSVHRQRLSLFSLVDNQRFLHKKRSSNSKKSDIGGKPWIHGVGADKETDVHLTEESRKGNTVVFGETGVGKSQTESLLVAQDIYKNQSVLVIDPKGDLSLLQNIYLACAASNRLNDLYIIHAGIPDLSAKYNPLNNYMNVSEVATRITSAIAAEGEGKQFQDFAWKFLNITAACLEEMDEPITYKILAFFVTKPKVLLLTYCDKILPKKDPDYLQRLNEIIRKSRELNKDGESTAPMKREEAARVYVAEYIAETIKTGKHKTLHDSIIADLSHAADLGEEYYSKITACLGPVFDKINKTSAGKVFSWDNSYGLPVINLEGVIKRKQIVYICLDSQSNKAMAEAVGQAIIADLVSLCGRLYKEIPNLDRLLYLHADEFSEIVRDDFINLLNKARGAGVRVTAYTQTVNDLGVAFGSSHDKPKMLLGNFSNMVMMRVGNLDTARIFTECLEEVKTRSTTPSTMSNDRPDGHNGDLFTSYNTDTINEQRSKIIVENDLFSLPKGQAMMLTNGGELYKTRIPLLKTEYHVPESFESLMSEVNLCHT